MNGKLYFDLAEAIRIARATMEAPDHRVSFGDQMDGKETGPALMWVKDSGTYLMSNALPRVENDVLYGRAHTSTGLLLDDSRRDDVWHTTREICGGDDFAEYLPLPTLLSDWEAVATHHTWLVLIVGDESIDITTEAAR